MLVSQKCYEIPNLWKETFVETQLPAYAHESEKLWNSNLVERDIVGKPITRSFWQIRNFYEVFEEREIIESQSPIMLANQKIMKFLFDGKR